MATATTGKLSNPLQLYIPNWNSFHQVLGSKTVSHFRYMGREYTKAVKHTLLELILPWNRWMDSGATAGLLQPVPGMSIPHIHRHSPLGYEGTTWQRGAVGHMVILSIVRKDCPALGSNKEKYRVCSALLQMLKEDFGETEQLLR